MLLTGCKQNPFGERRKVAHSKLGKDGVTSHNTFSALQIYLHKRPKYAEYDGLLLYKNSDVKKDPQYNFNETEFAVCDYSVEYQITLTSSRIKVHKIYVHRSLQDDFPELFETTASNNKLTHSVSTSFDRTSPVSVANKLILLHEKGTPVNNMLRVVSKDVLKKSLAFISINALSCEIQQIICV